MGAASTEVAIASWYSASLVNNYATPSLLDLLGSPLTLNMLEQAAMILVAIVAFPVNRVTLIPTRKTTSHGQLPIILAMGLANAITARLFMVSLQHLPLSLCHTIRACSPCVAAAIGLLRGKDFSPLQLLSLPVIVSGFALAVSAQPSCSRAGVCAALASLVAMSAQQHLAKGLLEGGMHELQCQFLQCALCLAFLAGGNCGNNARDLGAVRDLAAGGGGARNASFRRLTLLNGASDYVENIASTKACAAFDELTFSVLDTLRRLSVILICGFAIRKNPARPSNVSGTLLVLAGALIYQRGSSSSDVDGDGKKCNDESPAV